jgi:hypothetical protein
MKSLANFLGNRLMVGQTIPPQAIDLAAIRFPNSPKTPTENPDLFRFLENGFRYRSLAFSRLFSSRSTASRMNAAMPESPTIARMRSRTSSESLTKVVAALLPAFRECDVRDRSARSLCFPGQAIS